MFVSKRWSCSEWDCDHRDSNEYASDNADFLLTTENEKTADLFTLLDALREKNPEWVVNTTSRGEKSGFRTPEVNALCGGEENSQHLYGCAADCHISTADLTGEELAQIVRETAEELGLADKLGLGVYEDWVHIDTRGYSANW